MNIEKLNINGFGKLISKEIKLNKGLNIIYAPNESGKSTTASFIKFMLYGFSKKERASEKNPVTSKQKYIPWEGQQASGSVRFTLKGNDYTISRTAKKTTQTFSVNDSITGEQLSVYKEPGEEFFGISLETFESTAYFSQASFSSLEMDELESKLRNMATGADEEVSYEKASTKLKSLFNKISGSRAGSRSKISLLTAKKEQLAQKKAAIENVLNTAAPANLEMLRSKIENLETMLENKKQEIENNTLPQTENDPSADSVLAANKSRLEAYSNISDITREELNSFTIEYYRCKAELNKYSDIPAAPKRSNLGIWMLILSFVFAVIGAVIWFEVRNIFALVLTVIAPVLLITGIILIARANKKYLSALSAYETEKEKYGELTQSVAQVRRMLAKYDLAGGEISEGLKRLDNLVEERDALKKDIVKAEEVIEKCRTQNKEQLFLKTQTLEKEYRELETEYNSLRITIAEKKADSEKIAQAKETLASIENEIEQNEQALSQCREDAACVLLAMDCLDNAHNEMIRLFAPALNKAASSYVKEFSAGERTLTVDAKGNIRVCENGVIRPLGYYSEGTVDAIYVAVRLALIDLLYNDEKPPLVFDDTFANLDERRLKKMMELLSSLDSQIIYFTCRDPRPFIENNNYNLIEL